MQNDWSPAVQRSWCAIQHCWALQTKQEKTEEIKPIVTHKKKLFKLTKINSKLKLKWNHKTYAIISLFVYQYNLAFSNSATGYPAVIILQRNVWLKRWTKAQRHIHTNTNSFKEGQLTKDENTHIHTQTQCKHIQMPYPIVYCISFYSHQTNDESLIQFVRKSGWRTQKHSSEKWCWALVQFNCFSMKRKFCTFHSTPFSNGWFFFPFALLFWWIWLHTMAQLVNWSTNDWFCRT